MTSKLKFLLTSLLLGAVMSCGTGIGNPIGNASTIETNDGIKGSPLDASPQDVALDFSKPISEYNQDTSPSQSGGIECGSFTEANTIVEVDTGRQCLRDALASCHVARYLINQTTSSGRFVAYVAVKVLTSGACEIARHTVSTNDSLYKGESSQSCTALGQGTLPELACL